MKQPRNWEEAFEDLATENRELRDALDNIVALWENDAIEGFKQVQLWHIHGITGEYFATKLAAEVRARNAFPHESADRLYARIFFTKFFKED